MVTASRRGPRTMARLQRAASHIMATESGPPDTASASAGALLQAANRRFASAAEIGEWSSSGMIRAALERRRACARCRKKNYPGRVPGKAETVPGFTYLIYER